MDLLSAAGAFSAKSWRHKAKVRLEDVATGAAGEPAALVTWLALVRDGGWIKGPDAELDVKKWRRRWAPLYSAPSPCDPAKCLATLRTHLSKPLLQGKAEPPTVPPAVCSAVVTPVLAATSVEHGHVTAQLPSNAAEVDLLQHLAATEVPPPDGELLAVDALQLRLEDLFTIAQAADEDAAEQVAAQRHEVWAPVMEVLETFQARMVDLNDWLDGELGKFVSREFREEMASAAGVSAFDSATLLGAMAAVLSKPEPKEAYAGRARARKAAAAAVKADACTALIDEYGQWLNSLSDAWASRVLQGASTQAQSTFDHEAGVLFDVCSEYVKAHSADGGVAMEPLEEAVAEASAATAEECCAVRKESSRLVATTAASFADLRAAWIEASTPPEPAAAGDGSAPATPFVPPTEMLAFVQGKPFQKLARKTDGLRGGEPCKVLLYATQGRLATVLTQAFEVIVDASRGQESALRESAVAAASAAIAERVTPKLPGIHAQAAAASSHALRVVEQAVAKAAVAALEKQGAKTEDPPPPPSPQVEKKKHNRKKQAASGLPLGAAPPPPKPKPRPAPDAAASEPSSTVSTPTLAPAAAPPVSEPVLEPPSEPAPPTFLAPPQVPPDVVYQLQSLTQQVAMLTAALQRALAEKAALVESLTAAATTAHLANERYKAAEHLREASTAALQAEVAQLRNRLSMNETAISAGLLAPPPGLERVPLAVAMVPPAVVPALPAPSRTPPPPASSPRGKPKPKAKAKTKLCQFFEKNGRCRHGEACAFAHGEAQLQAPRAGTPPEVVLPPKARRQRRRRDG